MGGEGSLTRSLCAVVALASSEPGEACVWQGQARRGAADTAWGLSLQDTLRPVPGPCPLWSFFKTQFPIYRVFSGSKTTLLSKVVRPNVGGRPRRGSDLLILRSSCWVSGGGVVVYVGHLTPRKVQHVPNEGLFASSLQPQAGQGRLLGLPLRPVPLLLSYHRKAGREKRETFWL